MEKNFLYRCKKSGINSESLLKNCSNSKTRFSNRKKFVLLHCYLETGHISIVAFSDKQYDLFDIMHSHPRCGSNRHVFIITENCCGVFGDMTSAHPLLEGLTLNLVKDKCLINICKNVAEYLSVGEYAMLKKSYFKSAAWFEKAKNSASLGVDIIDNY